MPEPTSAATAATSPAAERATTSGMRLLSCGVPLTLLLDLAGPVDSSAIAADEGGSARWLPA